MSAFDKQEGGDHYKRLAIQPAEFCQKNRMGFMESLVVKYVARHREKNGAADIRKAIHCLELLLEMEYSDVPRGTSEDWDQGEKRMDAIGQNGNTGEHYSQWTLRPGADPLNPKAGDWQGLPWRVPEASKPVTGTFDVIQVMWHDGTYSVMLPHEFGKIAEWSEVKLYRVIRDGTSPDDFPLPEPVRQWGGHGVEKCLACQGIHARGAQCPDMTPHAGGHHHTINVGHYLDVGGPHSHTWPIGGPAQPSYSHTNGVGVIAGIASAVSGVNIALGGAAASINS